MKTDFPRLVAVIFVATAAIGCAKKNQFVAPPPPEVGVESPVIETTTVYIEYAGRTSASSRVEIRARVKGFLEEIHFGDGQFVKKDDKLFTIEQAQFESAKATAEAKLASEQAKLEIAEVNLQKRQDANERSKARGDGLAISDIEVKSSEADVKSAKAAVDIAQAALDDATRDLDEYTVIRAPMDGRVSSALVDKGNLVGAADPTLLTDIVTVQPIYFEFEGSEREALRYLKDMPNAENPTGSGEGKDKKLQLILADGTLFGEEGRFDFVDNAVNPETGTIRLRAAFENTEGLLVDGLFGRIRIPEEVKGAVLVPASAIQRDLGGSFVMVVDSENKVERRVVIPTSLSVDDKKIINAFDEETGTGLKAEDRFVVSNLQRVREGMRVRIAGEGGSVPSPNPAGEKEPAGEKPPAGETESSAEPSGGEKAE